MIRLILLAAIVLATGSARAADTAVEKSFRDRVAPLLKSRCLTCHGDGKELKGKLDLRTLYGMTTGGDNGRALVPGKAMASRLYTALLYNDEIKMPPSEKHRFSRDQIALVKLWIEAGAPWPKDVAMAKVDPKRANDDPTKTGSGLPDYHAAKPDFQYQSGTIFIPAATADEPVLEEWSPALAAKYLDEGALAWTRERQCVTCHTTGAYMNLRPMLTPYLGPPLDEVKSLFRGTRIPGEASADDAKKSGPAFSTTRIEVARGLANWDAFTTGKLSPATDHALRGVFDAQLSTGHWREWPLTWVPYLMDKYQGALVVARTVGTAPGWLEKVAADKDADTLRGIERLKSYLRDTPPVHDYHRVNLLWATTRWKGLLDKKQKAAILEMLAAKQQADGGWSMRMFATPETWGVGKQREAHLNAETFGGHPPSDAHMTGLAILVMRDSGVPANDPRIRRGLAWLKSNQRASGRWWTKSLNTDFWQFSTYHSTALALAALGACGEIPTLAPADKR